MGKVHLIVEGSHVGTLSGPIPPGGIQITTETAEGDAALLVKWMAGKYEWVDENGKPVAPTVFEIVEKFWGGFIQGCFDGANRMIEQEAAEKAVQSVQKISVKE